MPLFASTPPAWFLTYQAEMWLKEALWRDWPIYLHRTLPPGPASTISGSQNLISVLKQSLVWHKARRQARPRLNQQNLYLLLITFAKCQPDTRSSILQDESCLFVFVSVFAFVFVFAWPKRMVGQLWMGVAGRSVTLTFVRNYFLVSLNVSCTGHPARFRWS